MTDRAKQIIRAMGDFVGIQFANTNHLGVNFWHDFLRLNLRSDCFLDVGANVGQWATDARLHYPNVTIFSIEPEPQDFKTLRQHFQNDRHHRAIQCAVSDQIGTAELRVGGGTTNSLESRWTPLLGPGQRSIITQTDTIDHIAQRFNLEHIALLKIDVEGHELQCIKGADRMLREGRVDAVLVEVGFLGGIHTLFADIEKLLDEHGHHFLALYDLAPDYSGHARAVFANALFCRDELRLTG